MSDSYIDKIVCPECGREGEFTYWSNINTYDQPVMKNMVRTGAAFMYTCPECGKTSIVDFPFIYHQMEDQMMIYYTHGEDTAEAEEYFAQQNARFEELHVGGEMYLNRVVRSLDEFLEKLKIFDAGLDDRVIEVVKLTVAELAARQNPGISWDNIFYTYGPDGRQLLSFMKDGAAAFSVELPDELYNSIWIAYSSKWPALRMSEPVIDRKWAVSQIG
ncbi:MAG: CpXC domain-containing protein [Firmicutes bacterium]|nr:CpXC domain-containing protein [Bacillota bacterium]